MPTTPPTGTPPPDAPVRGDTSTFRARADDFAAWLVTFYSYLTSLVAWFQTTAQETEAKAALAAAYAQQPEGETVEGGGGYSALHHAAKAAVHAQATAVDRVQTGIDRTSAEASALAAGAAAGIPDLTGKAYHVMQVRSDELGYEFSEGAQLAVHVDEFLFAGTWTKRVGCYAMLVRCWAGGASGQRTDQSGIVVGGGGGEYIERWFLADELGDTESVVIGLGGAARTTNGDGAAGGDTLFGTHIMANGGNKLGNGWSGTGTPTSGGLAIGSWDGAGGGFANGLNGGFGKQSGGGGAAANSGSIGGLSNVAGAGGLGSVGGLAGSGEFPSGGGGGARSGGTSGAGGDGKIVVMQFCLEAIQ